MKLMPHALHMSALQSNENRAGNHQLDNCTQFSFVQSPNRSEDHMVVVLYFIGLKATKRQSR